MPSTIATRSTEFPPTLLLGASGRLGTMLRFYWRKFPLTAQSRRQAAGFVCFDPVSDHEALVDAISGHAVVICLAGVTGSGADLPQNNAIAQAVIKAAGAVPGTSVLLCSTAAVYGAGGLNLTEDTVPKPVNAYGKAKLDMENAALALAAEVDVPVCNLRIGNVAGADAILAGWTPGFTLDQLPDGSTPLRSYIGPKGLALSLQSLVQNARHLPGIMNVAYPIPVQMGALLDAADLSWTPRPAGAACVPAVGMNTGRLSKFQRFDTMKNPTLAVVEDWFEWCARGQT